MLRLDPRKGNHTGWLGWSSLILALFPSSDNCRPRCSGLFMMLRSLNNSGWPIEPGLIMPVFQ